MDLEDINPRRLGIERGPEPGPGIEHELEPLDELDTDTLIDRYLYLYTKGTKLRPGELTSARHKKASGESCEIFIYHNADGPAYLVEFEDSDSWRAYVRNQDGETWIIRGTEQTKFDAKGATHLLGEFEAFFGRLDLNDLLASRLRAHRDKRRYEGYRAKQFGEKVEGAKPSEFQDSVTQEASAIVKSRSWPVTCKDVVGQVLIGRAMGLGDKAIYRQIVFKYHPDITELDGALAEETLKGTQQFLWNSEDGSFNF